jgi:membrane fusion protein (multidrug efflux system)
VVLDLVATNVPLRVEFIGQLDSPQNVEVRARVEAFVEKMLFTEGTDVKEGDPLFLLDKKPFEQRLAAAKGALAEAKAALEKSRTDTNRLTPLAKAKAIPMQDLDNAVAAVAMGVASVQTADARVEAATIDLGYCDIRAPISGRIGAKQVSIGDLVGKGQPTLMATISTLNPMWFYCGVSQDQYIRAETETRRTGKRLEDLPVTLLLGNGAVHPAPGQFVFVDRALDVQTGTMRVRARFDNPDGLLRPGMFGRIRVDVGVRTNSIVVPERAVVELQGKTFAWVIGSENKTTQRPITVGETVGENVVVLEGLTVGQRVVVEGLQKVREGGAVQPVTVAQAQAQAQAAAKEAESKPAPGKAAAEGKSGHGKE